MKDYKSNCREKVPTILQGDKPGDDPNKYGLKFDSGKPRWDLIPMDALREIIAVPEKVMTYDFFNLCHFSPDEVYNRVMDLMSRYMSGQVIWKESLPFIGFDLFILLKGKAYTSEEIVRCSCLYRWDLFDVNEIQKVADVYSYGAKLYADNNWQRVEKKRYISAFFRHFKTVRTKARFDDESGFLHLHHAIWNIIALIWIDKNEELVTMEEIIPEIKILNRNKKAPK